MSEFWAVGLAVIAFCVFAERKDQREYRLWLEARSRAARQAVKDECARQDERMRAAGAEVGDGSEARARPFYRYGA